MSFRQLTDNERRLVNRLLEKDFPGRDAISEQVNEALVKQIDENGSLEFDVGIAPKAVSKFRIPTEGEIEDIDGVIVHVLLHVVDGRVSELEIFKEDNSPVKKMPDPIALRLFQPD